MNDNKLEGQIIHVVWGLNARQNGIIKWSNLNDVTNDNPYRILDENSVVFSPWNEGSILIPEWQGINLHGTPRHHFTDIYTLLSVTWYAVPC